MFFQNLTCLLKILGHIIYIRLNSINVMFTRNKKSFSYRLLGIFFYQQEILLTQKFQFSGQVGRGASEMADTPTQLMDIMTYRLNWPSGQLQ